MGAHAPPAPRRSRTLTWLTWILLLVPAIQLALAITLPGTGSMHRPAVAILEGLVLWWTGCCAIVTSLARGPQTAARFWFLLGTLLFLLVAAQLLAPHGSASTTLADAGLSVSLAVMLLLSVSAQVRSARQLASGLVQASFDALCLISGALVIQGSISPLVQGLVPAIDSPLALTVLTSLTLLVGIPLVAHIRPLATAVITPLLLALGCGFSVGILALALPELAGLLIVPLRTLAWNLIAIGAMNAFARLEQPISAVARPTLAGFTAPLLPWVMIALALVTIVATASVPPGLVALIVSGTSRELVASLQRYLREDDLVLALLWERHRLREEREASASRIRDIARVVHDLTAPLNGIRVVQRLLVCEQHAEASRLGIHTELLAVLINHLRDRIRGQTPPLRRVGVDTYVVANDALDSILERAQLAQIRTSTKLSTADARVIGDPSAVRRILDNLLANALDATLPGGAVAVEIWNDRSHPTMVTISVTDEGPGIEEQDLATLFAPRPLVCEGHRMGLGLSIVRELVEAMGGAYGVIANRSGSEFWVRLPSIEQ